MISILISPLAYADHGAGGGGGGCSGDCTPPTLGEDNSSRVFVNDGFGINNKFFDVAGFKQDVPTQITKVGDSVTVTIKVYENEGPHRLAHASLMLGIKTEVINGVQVDTHPVQISWEQTFDGKITNVVKDPNDLISSATVNSSLIEDAFGNENSLTEINFVFTPAKSFNANPLVVQVWDYDRNTWTNLFYNAIEFVDSDVVLQAQMGTTEFYDPKNEILKIPGWIKLNAELWSEDQIDDKTFVQGIKYCIENEIMNIPNLPDYVPENVLSFVDPKKGPQHYLDRYYNEPIYKEWFDETFPDYTIEEAVGLTHNATIPSWIKYNAELWANDSITDSDFVSGIEYLVENGIIAIS